MSSLSEQIQALVHQYTAGGSGSPAGGLADTRFVDEAGAPARLADALVDMVNAAKVDRDQLENYIYDLRKENDHLKNPRHMEPGEMAAAFVNARFAADDEAIRVLKEAITELEDELARWRSGELFSERAAALYEEQKKRIAELEEELIESIKRQGKEVEKRVKVELRVAELERQTVSGKIKVDLVFLDWQKDGKSVYHTRKGVDLSMGSLHSGSTFSAEVDLDEDDWIDTQKAIKDGYEPCFWVSLPESS